MDEFLSQYLNFEDWVDEDPYAEVPLHWFEPLDKVWTPTVPDFTPTAHDTILLGVDWDGNGPIVIYFTRGYGLVKVMLDRSFAGSDVLAETERSLEVQNALEVCQTFIHSVDFSGRAHTVMARRDARTGVWRHVARDSVPMYVCEAARLPLHVIPEDEVRITRLVGPGAYCEALWGDLPVDVQWPAPENVDVVVGDLAAFCLISPLPYTFRFVAALQRAGHVTALVCEPREGRPVRLADRPKVLRALRDLEALGIVYMSVGESHLVIGAADGEVKLSYPHRISCECDLAALDDPAGAWRALVDRRHRQAAENMFARLAARERLGIQGDTHLTRYWENLTTVVPRTARPEAFCGIELMWPDGWPSYADMLESWRDQIRLQDKRQKHQKREQRAARRLKHVPDEEIQEPGETMTGRVAHRHQPAQPTFVFWPGPPPNPAPAKPRKASSSAAHSQRPYPPPSTSRSWTQVGVPLDPHSSSVGSGSSFAMVKHDEVDAPPSLGGLLSGRVLVCI
jgi:hypothetical protein